MHPEGFRYDRVFFMSEGFGVTVLFLSDMLILAICKKRLLTHSNGKLYVVECCEDFYFGLVAVISV